MGFISDFKSLFNEGEIVNLATAVIVGGAFGKIVTSFTNDVLMPPIGLLLGKVDFKNLKVVLQDGVRLLWKMERKKPGNCRSCP